MPGRRIATVLMLDVVGSTHIAAQLGDARYRALFSRFARSVRAALKRFGGKEQDNAGDGFFVTFPQPDRAIRFATSLAEELRDLGIEIRCGIHTGQTESQDRKTQGIAVVIGSRVMSLAGPGEILVTNTTKELVAGSDFGFEDFSAHELKGVPGTWQVFAVTSVDGEARTQPLPADESAKRLGAVRPGTVRERRRRPALVAGALAGVVTIAILAFVATRDDSSTRPRPDPSRTTPGSLVQIDPETGEILDRIEAASSAVPPPGAVPAVGPHSLVVGQGGVWVTRFRGYVFHVDPLRHEVRRRIRLEVGDTPSAGVSLGEGFGSIWASFGEGLIRLPPATGEQELFTHVAVPGVLEGIPTDVTVGGGRVWLGRADGRLLSIDPFSRRDVRSLWTSGGIDAIEFGYGAVWTLDVVAGTVTKHDPDSMREVEVITVAGGGDLLMSGENGVWVLSRNLGSLTRIDLVTGEAAQIVQVGDDPTALAAGSGAIWVGDEDGLIRRVDEATRQVTEFPIGSEIRGLAFDDETDTIWVDVA
jgi:class 3 adenylate cyclase/streptogramin lyase